MTYNPVILVHRVHCTIPTNKTISQISELEHFYVQGGIFFLLVVGAVCFYITFAWTGSPWYIYGTVSLILLTAIYAGHYRARIRRRFNIIVSAVAHPRCKYDLMYERRVVLCYSPT